MKSHLQLSLFTKPLDPYEERIDATLLRSLRSMADANKRWDHRRQKGLSDSELQQAISFEFGSFGGATHPEWHNHEGGKDPKFWFLTSHAGKPTLRGKTLIMRVRSLMKIPYRQEKNQ